MPVVKKIRVHLSKTAICHQFICLFPYKIPQFYSFQVCAGGG